MISPSFIKSHRGGEKRVHKEGPLRTSDIEGEEVKDGEEESL